MSTQGVCGIRMMTSLELLGQGENMFVAMETATLDEMITVKIVTV